MERIDSNKLLHKNSRCPTIMRSLRQQVVDPLAVVRVFCLYHHQSSHQPLSLPCHQRHQWPLRAQLSSSSVSALAPAARQRATQLRS